MEWVRDTLPWPSAQQDQAKLFHLPPPTTGPNAAPTLQQPSDDRSNKDLPTMESDPLVSVQYSYTWAGVKKSACVLTSCSCSDPHSDGNAAETPGVGQLHWITGTGHFRQPHFLGWAKGLESSLMASAVSKHCSVQLICTSCLLQKVWESRNSQEHPSQGRQNSQSERRTEELFLPDLSENLFLHCCLNQSFLCLSNLQVAWQNLQLRIVKIGWLWRWDVLVYYTGNKMCFIFVQFYFCCW